MIRTGHFGKDQGHRNQVLMNVIALAGCNSRRAAKIQFSQRQKKIARDAGFISFRPAKLYQNNNITSVWTIREGE